MASVPVPASTLFLIVQATFRVRKGRPVLLATAVPAFINQIITAGNFLRFLWRYNAIHGYFPITLKR